MTASIATLTRSKAPKAATLAASLALGFGALATAADTPVWPDARYQGRPGDFAREVLGVQVLPEQEAVLLALDQPNARVSWTGGHKLGKDFSASVFALYFVCTYTGARVQLTAPTDKQVNEITWREIRLRIQHAKIPVADPLDIGDLARTGYVAPDFREIKGHTAKTAEAVAGISGPHVLYIVTEASGMLDSVLNAIEGNLAGKDARILLISNPTKSSGYAYETHHKLKHQWATFQHSSIQIADAQRREGVELPGLATHRWCAQKLESWGADDPRYKVRVLGQFVEAEQDKVMSLELITDAQRRWSSTPVLASDPLHIGIDPAYGGRDEIAYVPRRGRKVLHVRRFQEADVDRAADVLVTMIAADLGPSERGCVIRADRGGENGWKFVRALKRALRAIDPLGERITVQAVSFGDPVRRPASYVRFRDELWFTVREWLREGGAIPEDDKLETDLLAPSFKQLDNGKVSVEPKESIKARIGRSTDSADGLILSVWSHSQTLDVRRDDAPAERPAARQEAYEPVRTDPYAAMSAWEA